MTDEIQNDLAAGLTAQAAAIATDATSGMTVEEFEAKRNAKALETAKAGGYVAPAAPSIADRVNALVDGVQHAMNHNAPISREHFAEMKDLLGYRNPEPAQGDQAAV